MLSSSSYCILNAFTYEVNHLRPGLKVQNNVTITLSVVNPIVYDRP